MSAIGKVINSWIVDNSSNTRGLAKLMTDELQDRPYGKRSISHTAIFYMISGDIVDPEPSRWEWLAANAADERLRALAAEVLEVMANDHKED